MTQSDLKIEVEGSVLTVRLTGEIDLSNARAVEDAVLVATPNQVETVVLDMSTLDYLESAGIQLIYQLREKFQVRGQRLRLIIPTGSAAADALRLASVLDHLEIDQAMPGAPGATPSGEERSAVPAGGNWVEVREPNT